MRKKKGGRHGPSRAQGAPPTAEAPSSRRGPSNASVQATESFHSTDNHSFSMQDEARNTTRDHLKWDKDERLRYRPVTFVSGGLIEPLKEMRLESSATMQKQASPPEASSTPPKPPTTGDRFFVDTMGDGALRCEQPLPAAARPAGDSRVEPGDETDSSEDVILFKGRAAPRRATPPPTITLREMRREIDIVAEAQSQRLQARPLASSGVPHGARISAPSPPAASPPANTTALAASDAGIRLGLRPYGDDENDALADYIENMDGLEDLLKQHNDFATRDIGGDDGDVVIGAESDDDGSPDSCDNSPDHEDYVGGTADPSESVSEEENAPNLDDEQLARLLAKQEALGLGGDTLVLFDDSARWSTPIERSPPKASQRSNTLKPTPESAAAMADMFDDHDLLMDWDRTNPLRRKPKGKLAAVNFDCVDAELSAIMEASFERDRLRKKERKKEREELRAKGLLGKNVSPDDPRVKYVNGINLDELQQEFTAFLISADQILTLPPMDASARKVVHELAIKLKIKSKSTGQGDQRRPVLHRTKNTTLYNEDVMEAIFARAHRRFFPRLDKQRRPGAGAGGGGGARSGYAALRYRDGEIVGGSAPELGETNKGRAMLEKMGWTKGMGLGALDNKGILEPVAHVVKVSKAGLG